MKSQHRPVDKTFYPFYTSREMATLFGYSIGNTRIILTKQWKIPEHRIGQKSVYFLSEIRAIKPELYDSILEATSLNKMLQEQEKQETEEMKALDNDQPSVAQLL